MNFLKGIGFTNLEIEVYKYLLSNPDSTGYKISKSLGKHKANVYESLRTLVEKGAIFLEDSERQVYSAVLPMEIIGQYERKFHNYRTEAKRAQEKLLSKEPNEKILKLKTIEQVYERFAKILLEVQETALIEIFPDPLSILEQDICQASKKDIDLTIRVYEDFDMPGVKIVRSPFGIKTLGDGGYQWISIFADGKQFLVAMLDIKNQVVKEAIWSENMYLAWTFYGYVSRDLLHYSFIDLLNKVDSLDELKERYRMLLKDFPVNEDIGSKSIL